MITIKAGTNEHIVIPTIFPDGTSQVWHLPEWAREADRLSIVWNFEEEREIIDLLGLVELVEYSDLVLEIPYLPYARQDKRVSNNSTFNLMILCRILNSVWFDEVILHDPHSQKALNLIDRSRAVYPRKELNKALASTGVDTVLYPDAGARKKYSSVYMFPQNVIYGKKVRDQDTGNITGLTFTGDVKDKIILIVDDICDGGATFIKLTELLLEQGAKEVHLFVSHGLFTKGIDVLFNSGIKRIFTTEGEMFSQGKSETKWDV